MVNNPNWDGAYSSWRYSIASEVSVDSALQSFESDMVYMRRNGFKAMRLLFDFGDTVTDPRNIGKRLTTLQDLDRVIEYMAQNGIGVILDLQNWNDHRDGYFGSNRWITNWVNLVEYFKNDPRILAWEIFNEPFASTWDPSITGGGAGQYDGSDGVQRALARCVDAIRATGDTHPIVYPDPWYWSDPYDDMYHPTRWKTSQYYRPNIVVTFHEWLSTSNKDLYGAEGYWQRRRTVIAAWNQEQPIWIGELGMYQGEYDSDPASQEAYMLYVLNYCVANNIPFSLALHGYRNRTWAWDTYDRLLAESNYPSPPIQFLLSVNASPISGVPFTLNGTSLTTPYAAPLNQASYVVTMPSNVQSGGDLYNFSQWQDGIASPSRTINLTTDMSLTAIYTIQPTPPEKGILDVHASLDGLEIVADCILIETGQPFKTPVKIELDPSVYTISANAIGKTLEQTAIVQGGQTIRLDFDFSTPTPKISILPIIAIAGFLLSRGK